MRGLMQLLAAFCSLFLLEASVLHVASWALTSSWLFGASAQLPVACVNASDTAEAHAL